MSTEHEGQRLYSVIEQDGEVEIEHHCTFSTYEKAEAWAKEMKAAEPDFEWSIGIRILDKPGFIP